MLATPGGSWKGQHRTDHGGEQLFPRTYAPPGAKGYKKKKNTHNYYTVSSSPAILPNFQLIYALLV